MAATLEHELESLHELEFEGEGEFELEGKLEGEGELEFSGEGELEYEVSPVRKIYADAMMEHLAHLAAEAQTEQEAAEHFLPLVGLAAKKLLPVVAKAVAPSLRKALPSVARAVTRVEPRLTRGITSIARTLYRRPGTRRLLHAVPTIARRTVHSIANQAAHGRPITARGAVRTLARQTSRVLGQPHRRRTALRRSAWLDRRFHGHVGRGVVRPHIAAPGYVSTPGGYAPAPGAYLPAAGGYAPAPGGYAPTAGYGPSPVGRVACAVCPPCGHAAVPTAGGTAPAPAYCRCCGQILR
jgi:hypothetical protein